MEVLDAIRGRRAINFFDPRRKVPVETLKEIISTAALAPSSYNLQPWEIVLVTTDERKAILRKCAFNQPKVAEASAVLIFTADPGAVEDHIDRVIDNMIELGYSKEEDREKSRSGPAKHYGERDSLTRKIFAVKNTAFMAMNFMIAARGFGLETHPMDGFTEDMVKEEFSIPSDRIIPLLVAVGYPVEGLELLPGKFRRGVDEIVKMENFE